MDFTFIFLIILMLLAAQNGIMAIAVVMLVLAFVTAKNRYALYGAVVAAGLLVGTYLDFFKDGPELLIGGIFIIFLIAVKGDEPTPPGYAGYPGMPGY